MKSVPAATLFEEMAQCVALSITHSYFNVEDPSCVYNHCPHKLRNLFNQSLLPSKIPSIASYRSITGARLCSVIRKEPNEKYPTGPPIYPTGIAKLRIIPQTKPTYSFTSIPTFLDSRKPCATTSHRSLTICTRFCTPRI